MRRRTHRFAAAAVAVAAIAVVLAPTASASGRRGLSDLRTASSGIGISALHRANRPRVVSLRRVVGHAHRRGLSPAARVRTHGSWLKRNAPPVYWLAAAAWRAALDALTDAIIPIAPAPAGAGGKEGTLGVAGRAVAVESREDPGEGVAEEGPVAEERPPEEAAPEPEEEVAEERPPAEEAPAEEIPSEEPAGGEAPGGHETPAESPVEEPSEEPPAGESPGQSETPEAPSESSGGGEAPETGGSEAPGSSETPEAPETPEGGEAPESHETPNEAPATPETGRVLFEGSRIADFEIAEECPGAISEVAEPLGGTGTVLSFTVHNGDHAPKCTATENPRATLHSPGFIEPGDEFWLRSRFMVPSGFPEVTGWMTLISVFGGPEADTSPWRVEVKPVNGEMRLTYQRNATYGYDMPWSEPLPTGRWVEVLLHERFATDGFIEEWIDGKKLRFWTPGSINPSHQPETEKLEMETADYTNYGTDSVRIGQYREVNMFEVGTVYYQFVKVGTTRESVGG